MLSKLRKRTIGQRRVFLATSYFWHNSSKRSTPIFVLLQNVNITGFLSSPVAVPISLSWCILDTTNTELPFLETYDNVKSFWNPNSEVLDSLLLFGKNPCEIPTLFFLNDPTNVSFFSCNDFLISGKLLNQLSHVILRLAPLIGSTIRRTTFSAELLCLYGPFGCIPSYGSSFKVYAVLQSTNANTFRPYFACFERMYC